MMTDRGQQPADTESFKHVAESVQAEYYNLEHTRPTPNIHPGPKDDAYRLGQVKGQSKVGLQRQASTPNSLISSTPHTFQQKRAAHELTEPVDHSRCSIRYSFKSQAGQENSFVKKKNQDQLFIITNFSQDPNSWCMGVCDGHGSFFCFRG